MATFVTCQCKQDNPLSVILKERLYTVFAHVWSNSNRIKIILFEERLGIHLRCVTDITTLSISNDKVVWMVLLYILNGLFKCQHTFQTIALIESKVWFICYAIRCCCINDCLVESKDRVILILQVRWYLVDISVKSHT